MHHYYNYHMMDGYGAFALLLWLVLLIDLILLGVWLIKQIGK